MTRRQLRESIFKAVFRVEFHGRQDWPEQLDDHLRELELPDMEQEDEQPETVCAAEESDIAYIRAKATDICAHIAELDEAIEQHIEGWRLNRIGKAELTILRLAVYEIRMDEDVPQGVAINEAVELTKRYCDEEAAGFVNAVLGKLVKETA